MTKIFKKIREFFLNHNVWISRTTDKQQLLDFFESVRPKKTNHPLIRIGGNTDGGYLLPNDIDAVDACFSPGVSIVADFENDLANRGIRCFLADYSVDQPPLKNELFEFEKKYLGTTNDEIFMTLESWIKLKAPSAKEAILQMDIEGAEYGVIFDTPIEVLAKFRVLVIEFHGLDSLFNKRGFQLIDLIFAKILKNFVVVHIHPNNCYAPVECGGICIPPLMEFTFLRKDRISDISEVTSFPHKFDRPNVLKNEDFPLPKCWFAPPKEL
jgi:hypothetical protein